MGADIHSLYKDVLGKSKAIIVGIDIGSMVATALALRFREDVIGLYASECPQPGTFLYDESTTDDAFKYELVYHFFFHMAPDNWAENLTVGKEKYYINSFYKRLTSKPDFLSGDDLEVYTKAFTGYDRMRAGFEVYRAFLQDRDDVRNDIKQNGKLGANVPVLASGGTKSKFTEYTEEMMSELAENVKHVAVEDSGHWIPEEAPENFVKVLTDWIKNDLKQI